MKQLMAILLAVVWSIPVLADYTYEITSGYTWDLTLIDNETLLMTGGGGDNLTGRNNSILDIRNTSSPVIRGVSGIASLDLNHSSHLDFSGGCVAQLSVHGSSTVILNGGQIAEIWGYYGYPDPTRIKIICDTYQLIYNGMLVTKITGTWLDDSTFSINLKNQSGYSPVFDNMTIIPEPASLILIAVGGLLLRCKRN